LVEILKMIFHFSVFLLGQSGSSDCFGPDSPYCALRLCKRMIAPPQRDIQALADPDKLGSGRAGSFADISPNAPRLNEPFERALALARLNVKKGNACVRRLVQTGQLEISNPPTAGIITIID
jgi:hypothetical protein